MGLFKSTKLAWSIAIASLALWAASAPLSVGQAAPIATRLLQQTTDESTSTSSIDTVVTNDPTTTTSSDKAAPCPAVPEAMTQSPTPVPTSITASSAPAAADGTFQICGPDDAVARAIEQLIAGRSFSASLTTAGNGCASLTIKATSASASGGRAASTLNISPVSGQRLSIQIVSEGGATHVSIGQGS